ncbi:MAG: dTDP-rhamnosyl transferase RfbF [Ramlibacter sp.]|nr:dTDP-rhamnosyl transferase RfbF [Ramlibacter sp.]
MDTPAGGDTPQPLVWACVVCFHPDPSSLCALLRAIAPQVRRVILIDNSPGEPQLPPEQLHGALHVPMPRNAGTAGGLNEAWRQALAAGATHLVSFDQDSRPTPNLVHCLLAALERPSTKGRPLAAVGPVWTDERSGRTMRVLAPVRFLRRHVEVPDAGLIEVNHVITSGCLVSAAAYRAVGEFDEDLFLDYVDIEWSLRARAGGYALAVAANCRMSHAIGERMLQIAGRQVAVHSPLRSYLQLRNHLLLWRVDSIPRLWLLSDSIQVAAKLLVLLLLAPARTGRMRCIFRGLVDGLRGRGGPPPAAAAQAESPES